MPRRRGLRPRLLAAVVRSRVRSAFTAERQNVGRTNEMLKVFLVYLTVGAGCSIHAPSAPTPTNASLSGQSVPEECRLVLPAKNEQEARGLKDMAAACDPLDRCLLACYATECGRDVGGGCSHLCSARGIFDPKVADATRIRWASDFLDARQSGQCPR